MLKHYPKKGSISFHRLPRTPFHGVEKLNEKILGSPSNIQGQLRLLPHVRPEAGAHRTDTRQLWSSLTCLSAPSLRNRSSVTTPEFSLNLFQRRGAAEISVRGRQGVQPRRLEPPSGGRHPQSPGHVFPRINTPFHPTAHRATVLDNHSSHFTRRGQTELWGEPHSSLTSLQEPGTRRPHHSGM